jgi:SAM-dependent methyltransferase
MNALQYPTPSQNPSLFYFFEQLSKKKSYSVLEIGTKRWSDGPTHHKDLMPNFETYTMTDVTGGIDVDVVSDAHKLSSVFYPGSFDVVWSSSVWEHLHSPWEAAHEVLKVLKPGGLFFIQTHQIFPEHGYPHDYFRYTTEGLKRLFSAASSSVASYDFPCTITPHNSEVVWNKAAPAYLNVNIAGVK